MVDIQSATAEIRRGKKEDRNHRAKIKGNVPRRAAIISGVTIIHVCVMLYLNGFEFWSHFNWDMLVSMKGKYEVKGALSNGDIADNLE